MGMLTWAGAASGAGKAVEKGLDTLQGANLQAALQEQRDKMDTARLQLTEQYAGQRQASGFANDKALQGSNQTFTTGENDKTRALSREQHAEDATDKAGAHADTVALGRATLAHAIESDTEKNRIAAETGKAHQNYYQAYADYYLKGGGKAGSSGAKIDLDTRKAGADFFSKRIAPLEKQLIDPLTTKEERAVLQERIESLSKEGLGILGFTFGKESEGSDIVDPLGDLPPAGGNDKTKNVNVPGPAATVTKPRGERSVVAPSAPSAGPLEALRGGAQGASQGLMDMATPYSTPSDITIEKRKRPDR